MDKTHKRLQELSRAFHRHPDEGGSYLSAGEMHELCGLQKAVLDNLWACPQVRNDHSAYAAWILNTSEDGRRYRDALAGLQAATEAQRENDG